MNDKPINDPPQESTEIGLESVKFNRTWVFWENYAAKSKQLSYKDSMNAIFEWGDIITFWQFWNSYPGSNANAVFFNGDKMRFFFKEKYRINAMNVFVKGILPAWEDQANKGGRCLQLEYKIDNEIQKFFAMVSEAWKTLMLNLMGENLPGVKDITGVRFIDKTQFEKGKLIMFRFEVWVSKVIDTKDLNALVEYLKKQFGCGEIDIKNIPS